MKIAKHIALIAAAVIFMAVMAACNSESEIQTPTENISNGYDTNYIDVDYDQHISVAPPAEPTPIPLTTEKVDSLTAFFADFGGWFGMTPALGDYDVSLPESLYVALDFVLSSRVFRHGREGILGYPHYGYVAYMGGERFNSWEDMTEGVVPMHEFITSAYVDSVLWSLFGITGFEHGVSEFTPTFGFRYYYGGYYYRFLAQGGGDMAVIHIAELYDNGNGTYSVVIEYIWADYGMEPVHMQYNVAVIQPFASTYQMLYWQNDVPRNTIIPMRQPIA